MSYELVVCLSCKSSEEVDVIIHALTPENHEMDTNISVNFEKKENILKMRINTQDVSSIRAVMNSYMRWIEIARKVYALN